MKRFYKDVQVSAADGRYAVLLDGRAIKTPKRAVLALPTKSLAEAVAEEWRAQGEEVNPLAMHLTKLANTAIDRVHGRESEVVEQILAYANDLLCYRAASPADLAARQEAEWGPLLGWAAERFGARLQTGEGVMHFAQPGEAMAALRRAVEAYDPFLFAAQYAAASMLGSLVLMLALAEGRLTAETAFALSQLDERYQAERWGEDEQASARAAGLLAELKAVERFLRLAITDKG
jgi:chaperone required for assembly of F1-ATPase